jgi:hypothetical protein
MQSPLHRSPYYCQQSRCAQAIDKMLCAQVSLPGQSPSVRDRLTLDVGYLVVGKLLEGLREAAIGAPLTRVFVSVGLPRHNLHGAYLTLLQSPQRVQLTLPKLRAEYDVHAEWRKALGLDLLPKRDLR